MFTLIHIKLRSSMLRDLICRNVWNTLCLSMYVSNCKHICHIYNIISKTLSVYIHQPWPTVAEAREVNEVNCGSLNPTEASNAYDFHRRCYGSMEKMIYFDPFHLGVYYGITNKTMSRIMPASNRQQCMIKPIKKCQVLAKFQAVQILGNRPDQVSAGLCF